MLYAIQHNKAGRNFGHEEINWKHLFKSSEDSFTSMVFSRLYYLPYELFWNIIRESCYGNELPSFPNHILSKEFWPSWDAFNTSNSNRVEPDVFIRFQQFDLIIEAKRWDNNQQSKDQWTNEIRAYRNEYGSSGKQLYFIALGGLSEEATEILEGVTILKCRWYRILGKVKENHNRLANSTGILNSIDPVLNVLNDLMMVFQLHGFATGEWLSSMPNKDYRIGSSLNMLINNPLKLDSKQWFKTFPINYKINHQTI